MPVQQYHCGNRRQQKAVKQEKILCQETQHRNSDKALVFLVKPVILPFFHMDGKQGDTQTGNQPIHTDQQHRSQCSGTHSIEQHRQDPQLSSLSFQGKHICQLSPQPQ